MGASEACNARLIGLIGTVAIRRPRVTGQELLGTRPTLVGQGMVAISRNTSDIGEGSGPVLLPEVTSQSSSELIGLGSLLEI